MTRSSKNCLNILIIKGNWDARLSSTAPFEQPDQSDAAYVALILQSLKGKGYTQASLAHSTCILVIPTCIPWLHMSLIINKVKKYHINQNTLLMLKRLHRLSTIILYINFSYHLFTHIFQEESKAVLTVQTLRPPRWLIWWTVPKVPKNRSLSTSSSIEEGVELV